MEKAGWALPYLLSELMHNAARLFLSGPTKGSNVLMLTYYHLKLSHTVPIQRTLHMPPMMPACTAPPKGPKTIQVQRFPQA